MGQPCEFYLLAGRPAARQVPDEQVEEPDGLGGGGQARGLLLAAEAVGSLVPISFKLDDCEEQKPDCSCGMLLLLFLSLPLLLRQLERGLVLLGRL